MGLRMHDISYFTLVSLLYQVDNNFDSAIVSPDFYWFQGDYNDQVSLLQHQTLDRTKIEFQMKLFLSPTTSRRLQNANKEQKNSFVESPPNIYSNAFFMDGKEMS